LLSIFSIPIPIYRGIGVGVGIGIAIGIGIDFLSLDAVQLKPLGQNVRFRFSEIYAIKEIAARFEPCINPY
jgi:hypothetical protein